MSLQFYFGASGSGKSRLLHENLISASLQNPAQNILLIVPDQFTMQTQKDIVTEHPKHGIMNMDVLSFGRLTHRILEETGDEETPVLDDIGKSLLLRKVAQTQEEKLPLLGRHLHKIGYINEVKSAISEFMQYGIAPETMSEMTGSVQRQDALCGKLRDLECLYRSFCDYIRDKFITTEERLDILAKALHDSQIAKGCVVAFDGFTGFTPVQYRVMQAFMEVADKVIVTMTLDAAEDASVLGGEQELFYLSKKTVHDLTKLAEEAQCSVLAPAVCAGEADTVLPRFAENPELAHLERHLFRYPLKPYAEKPSRIHICKASSVREEVRQTAIEIRRLLAGERGEKGLQYRDIAIVTGSMDAYGDLLEEEFAKFGIPLYVDKTRAVLGNPLTEAIRSALEIVRSDFSMESIFHYLRTGMSGLDRDDIDRLENYVRRFGISGRRRWERIFDVPEPVRGRRESKLSPEETAAAQTKAPEKYNGLREILLAQLKPLMEAEETAQGQVQGLYDFLVANRMQDKMEQQAEQFRRAGDLTSAREYSQIYGKIIDLLDQIVGLLGTDAMSPKEFAEILDAGFGEIRLGTIPQNVDRILAGDIERTRLRQIKVVFFLGVNDGNIPKGASKGGILSDIDREILAEAGWELAPTPRQQMYTQRLYLYLNLTKPNGQLYVSYACVGGDGKSLQPAYLIGTLQQLFPEISVDSPEEWPLSEQLADAQDGLLPLSDALRLYAGGQLFATEESFLFGLYHMYGNDPRYAELSAALLREAFFAYRGSSISKEVVRALYGEIMKVSVSRLENYAACACRDFLTYGLSLQERQEYGFENVDLGNVFHDVLKRFGEKVIEKGTDWMHVSQEDGEKILAEILDTPASEREKNTFAVLNNNARSRHQMDRIRRVLTRSVNAIQMQLRRGSFVPEGFELSFSMLEDDKGGLITLKDGCLRLDGRIDRVDICEWDDNGEVYVKVVDYKSGKHELKFGEVLHGLNLQLPTYMNAALQLEAVRHPGRKVRPAAMLYYHVTDPMIDRDKQAKDAEWALLDALKMKGVVNADDTIVSLLDHATIPGAPKQVSRELRALVPEGQDEWKLWNPLQVSRTKDGPLRQTSHAFSEEDLRTVLTYADRQIQTLGARIFSGDISVAPYRTDKESACKYCPYKGVCGFDQKIQGFQYRTLSLPSDEDALAAMRQLPDTEVMDAAETPDVQ